MNRLAFQPVLRAARVAQRPSIARNIRAGCSSTTATSTPKRYASTSSAGAAPTKPTDTTVVTPPSPEFEKMLSTLFQGMKSEDLAKRVAVLYMMTDKKNEIEQVEKRLHSIMRGQDFKPVSERIKHYLKNPPEELFSMSPGCMCWPSNSWSMVRDSPTVCRLVEPRSH